MKTLIYILVVALTLTATGCRTWCGNCCGNTPTICPPPVCEAPPFPARF